MRTPVTIRTASGSAYAIDRDDHGLTLMRLPRVYGAQSDEIGPIPSSDWRRDGELLRLYQMPELVIGARPVFAIQVVDDPGVITFRHATAIVEIVYG